MKDIKSKIQALDHLSENASENTDIEDIFKLNLNIQAQYGLDNLGFLKNIEIVIKVLDEPTNQFLLEFEIVRKKVQKLCNALCPFEKKKVKKTGDEKVNSF